MKPDPIWILVWMVALNLVIQIYATVRTFGVKRLARGPKPARRTPLFDPLYYVEDVDAAGEADFDEISLEETHYGG